MIEQPEQKYESQKVLPEKGWASFLYRLRQGVVEKANDLIKARPEEEAITLAEVDMIDEILKEIGETKPEERRRLIENFWQEKKIPEDIYQKLVGRMEVEVELEKLEAEVGLGKEKTKEKITVPEAAKVVADEIKEAVETKSFWSSLREKITGKIKAPEIWQKLKDKKILGQTVPAFLIGLGTGAAVRTTVRWGLGALSGGAGYALAISSGAASGAILEGIKSYKKEKGREKAALSEEEFEKKTKELRGKKNLEKLEQYLELAKQKESTIWTEERNKLRQELEKKLQSAAVRKEVIRGVLKGALIGAMGGAVGGYLAHLAEGYFAPTGLKEAAKAAKTAGGVILERGQLESFAADAYAKTYEKSLVSGLAALKEKSFSVPIEKGQGFTHIARNLVHDYLVQNQALGSDLRLDKAQLIYAEDTLSKALERGDEIIQQGYSFTTDGEAIAKAIERAKNLSKAQLENLKENFVPKIAEKTWKEITDYGSLYNDDNNVASEVLANAQEKSAEAANKIVKEAMQTAAEAQKISSQIMEAKDSWFRDNWAKYGLGAAWIAAAVGTTMLGYKLGLGKSSGGVEGTALQEETLPVNAVGPVVEPAAGGEIEAKKPEKITGETNLHLRKILTERIGNKIEIARSDFSTGLEMEQDGLKRLEQLTGIDKSLFEKIKGSLLYMTTDKTAEIGKDNSRVIIPIDPRLTVKQMRHYLEEAAEKAKKL